MASCSDWFSHVLDPWLASANAPLSMLALMHRAPFEIPAAPDFPSIGHWTLADMAAAAPAIQTRLATVAEEELRESLVQVLEWIEEGLRRPDCTVIGVYE